MHRISPGGFLHNKKSLALLQQIANSASLTRLLQTLLTFLWLMYTLFLLKYQLSVCLTVTAAFDTADQQLLLHRLERQFGLRGVDLAWFSSYLIDRSFRILLDGVMSSVVCVLCSVPLCSVLGPRLFVLHTVDPADAVDSTQCKVPCIR